MWAAAFRLSGDREQSGVRLSGSFTAKDAKYAKKGIAIGFLIGTKFFIVLYVFVKHVLFVPLRLFAVKPVWLNADC
jgi:hypothetical protein